MRAPLGPLAVTQGTWGFAALFSRRASTGRAGRMIPCLGFRPIHSIARKPSRRRARGEPPRGHTRAEFVQLDNAASGWEAG
jgi:hypothetical protein